MGAKVHTITELQHRGHSTHVHSQFVNLRDQDADDSWGGSKASPNHNLVGGGQS